MKKIEKVIILSCINSLRPIKHGIYTKEAINKMLDQIVETISSLRETW